MGWGAPSQRTRAPLPSMGGFADGGCGGEEASRAAFAGGTAVLALTRRLGYGTSAHRDDGPPCSPPGFDRFLMARRGFVRSRPCVGLLGCMGLPEPLRGERSRLRPGPLHTPCSTAGASWTGRAANLAERPLWPPVLSKVGRPGSTGSIRNRRQDRPARAIQQEGRCSHGRRKGSTPARSGEGGEGPRRAWLASGRRPWSPHTRFRELEADEERLRTRRRSV